MEILKRLTLEIPLNSAILLLDIFPEELKTSCYMCAHVYTAQLIGANPQKWPIHALTDEWIKNLLFAHSGVLVCHKEKLESFIGT